MIEKLLYTVFLTMVLSWTIVSGADEIAIVNGDVNIAGLFEIQTQDGDGCGQINSDSVMVLEAVRWYLEQLNYNNSLPFQIGKK